MSEPDIPEEHDVVAVFDLEGTLSVNGHVFRNLNRSLGIPEEKNFEMYHRFNDGEITYTEMQDWLVEEWEHPEGGTPPREYFEEFFASIEPDIKEEAYELVEEMKDQGAYTVLLSGALDEYSVQAAEELGMDLHVDTLWLEYDEEEKVEEIAFNGYKGDKSRFVESIDGTTLFFGNGYNDITAVEAADLGYMVTNKDIDYGAIDCMAVEDLDEIVEVVRSG